MFLIATPLFFTQSMMVLLDMPAMTMAFRVNNPKLLDDLAVGDQVRFSADKVAGSYMIVTLFKAP